MENIGTTLSLALLATAVALVTLAAAGVITWFVAGWVGTGLLTSSLFAYVLTRQPRNNSALQAL